MALKSAGTDPVGKAEMEVARGARGCFDCNAVMAACLSLLSKNPQTGQVAQVLEESRRNYVSPAPGSSSC